MRNVSRAGLPSHQLIPIAVNLPGSLGLNLQAQNSVQDPHWAIAADNCVIDQYGRVAARLGRTTISTGHAASGQVRSIFEYINSAGTSSPIVGFDGGISGSLIAPNGTSLVGTITSVASGRWFFQNFNDKCIGFQSGQKPIVCSTPGGTFSNIVEASGAAPQGGVGCCAYGRVWGMAADGHTLQWCALQDETNWGTGDSGSIDLRKVWPKGMDTCTAICAYGGTLVVFGTRQILFYGSTTQTVLGLDVTALRIVDAVEGVGCISQWTVAHIGGEKEHSDVFFCSGSGVNSLQRLVLASGSRPIQNLTKNIRDTLISQLSAEVTANVTGFYSPTNGFYALQLPVSGYTWIVDMRHRFDDSDGDEVSRVTRWPFGNTYGVEFSGRKVYFASSSVGHIQQYLTGNDDGSSFTVTLQTGWMDLGEDYAAFLKALKRVGGVFYSHNNTNITFSWYLDFNLVGTSSTVTVSGGTNAEYSIGQYSIDQYSGGGNLALIYADASGDAQYFSLGISAPADSSFAIQQLSLLAKRMRLA